MEFVVVVEFAEVVVVVAVGFEFVVVVVAESEFEVEQTKPVYLILGAKGFGGAGTLARTEGELLP